MATADSLERQRQTRTAPGRIVKGGYSAPRPKTSVSNNVLSVINRNTGKKQPVSFINAGLRYQYNPMTGLNEVQGSTVKNPKSAVPIRPTPTPTTTRPIGGSADRMEVASRAALGRMTPAAARSRIAAEVAAQRAAQGLDRPVGGSADRMEEQQVRKIYGTSTAQARKIINTQVDMQRAAQGRPPVYSPSEKVSQIPQPLVRSSAPGSLMAGWQPTGPISTRTKQPLIQGATSRDLTQDLRVSPTSSTGTVTTSSVTGGTDTGYSGGYDAGYGSGYGVDTGVTGGGYGGGGTSISNTSGTSINVDASSTGGGGGSGFGGAGATGVSFGEMEPVGSMLSTPSGESGLMREFKTQSPFFGGTQLSQAKRPGFFAVSRSYDPAQALRKVRGA